MPASCFAPAGMSCKTVEPGFHGAFIKLQEGFLGSLKDAAPADIRRTWNTWQSMIDRCMIPGHINGSRYRERGIVVCERWFQFANFADDMGARPAGMTLDRIDGDGPYEPSNCRWATPQEQANNTCRTVMVGNYTQREAARIAGVHESTISRRLARGLSPQEAMRGRDV